METVRNFKIGTFNLLNLVLPEVRYYGNRVYNQAVYQQKLTWISGQLDAMQADIVGFQEVFHEEALRAALHRSKHLTQAHILTAQAIGESPAVGLASRFPILSHEIIKDIPVKLDIEGVEIPIKQFSRPVLKAKIAVNPDFHLTFLVAHLKSKRPLFQEDEKPEEADVYMRIKAEARSTIRRMAEAVGLRAILLDELQHKQHPVVLVGDLNDNDLSVSTQLISGQPPFRNMPIEVKNRIWDTLLYHTKAIQSRKSYRDFYYTHIHNGHHEALDHILVSQELVAENPRSIGKIGYVKILTDHLTDETLSEESVPEWQSDHGQVVVSIELRSLTKR
jgi:endonuclease/exonuclease/phosphatase family metal-dependent hydrolase